MKKLKITLFVLLSGIILVSLGSCLYTEIGDPGPQGPVGEPGSSVGSQGPKGPQGPPNGTTDTVYYSEWKSYSGTMHGSRDYVATISVPELTENILDSVMVFVFYRSGAADDYNYTYKLPYTSATSGLHKIYATVEPKKIVLHATYNYFTSSKYFRYVIIPMTYNGQLARKASMGSLTDFDYVPFCDEYNIPK